MVSSSFQKAARGLRDTVLDPSAEDAVAAGGGLGLGLLSSELVGDRVRRELAGQRKFTQHLADVASRVGVAGVLAVAGERFGMGDLPGAILNIAAFSAGARAVHRAGEILWSELSMRLDSNSASASRPSPNPSPSTKRRSSSKASSTTSSSGSSSSSSSGRSRRATMSSTAGGRRRSRNAA